MDDAQITAFIARWQASGAAERANYQLFLCELCDLLEVPRPDPSGPDDSANAYVFERAVAFHHPDGSTTTGRIDLYKRGCFVLEAKQGADAARAPAYAARKSQKAGTALRGTSGWDAAMLRAKGQAENYVRELPAAEGRPPFILICDVGHTLECYAEFSQTGGAYTHFPNVQLFRVKLPDLLLTEVRERLRAIWTDPHSLDPAAQSARATRQIAARLAELAKSLEAAGQAPEAVAGFLMRCLFTMFAEDVGLLPNRCFATLLDRALPKPDFFAALLTSLWTTMRLGGQNVMLMEKLLRFNGHLFLDTTALPLDRPQIELLREAALADWRDVEPAIFGTLLERALDPRERHRLGAHYTPRAYVERLVLPTVIEPLRAQWDAVRAAAVLLADQERAAEARQAVHEFLRQLCHTRILDPACGTGNFLYVTLRLMKELEGEVLDLLERLGEQEPPLQLPGFTVHPDQFHGLEINPRAAAIADLVLWIGYLQWHYRTHGQLHPPPEPIIQGGQTIECRDAVLAYDGAEPATRPDSNVGAGRRTANSPGNVGAALVPRLDLGLADADRGVEPPPPTLNPIGVEPPPPTLSVPLTRWDGHTTKPHPVTGEPVPDESARVPVLTYTNPRPAAWPEADYVVGNPPFIGNKRMREALGDGYTEALRAARPEVPESCDFVMYWWDHAAELLRQGKLRRFGFITTNSLRQTFNRRVLQRHLESPEPVSLAFAIPDHPWVDAADGAAVRIAMTVAAPERAEGRLWTVEAETAADDGEVSVALRPHRGQLHADLSVGADVGAAVPLQANAGLCGQGVKLVAPDGGFFTPPSMDVGPLNPYTGQPIVRRYVSTDQVKSGMPPRLIIDFFGLTAEQARDLHPAAYQHVRDRVKPHRDLNTRKSIREIWWRYAWERPIIRLALHSLSRYIVTLSVSKHRYFVFVDANCVWDGALFAIASEDAFILGVLSSQLHTVWSLRAGGTLEDRPTWTNGTCFDQFPFPAATAAQQAQIRELGERLDAHRKRQQELHPGLTMTGMYNVLEKLRAGEALTAKDRQTHEAGLVSVLRELHDALDQAVAAAYGWPDLATPGGEAWAEEVLSRLVALNAARAAEEAQGEIRWLRPEYQSAEAEQRAENAGSVGAANVGAGTTPRPDFNVGAASAPRSDLGLPEPNVGAGTTPRPEEDRGAEAAPTLKDHRGVEPPPPTLDTQPPALAAEPWPKTLPEQTQAIRRHLAALGQASVEDLARRFQRAPRATVADIVATLASLGLAQERSPGLYTKA